MSTEFKRDELYEEVWTEPLTKLGARYGLSDNGLRKICKALNIPLPKAGHWAKVAAGHVVEKTPLPPEAGRTTYSANPPEPQDFVETSEDRSWREQQTQFERTVANKIVVDTSPRRWHSALIPLRDELRTRAKDYKNHLRVREQQAELRRRGALRGPDFSGMGWSGYEQHGLLNTHKALPMRVYVEGYERALLILNAFFTEADKRGFSVQYSEKDGRFILDGHDVSILVRITEKTIDQAVDPSESLYRSRKKVPTGQLRLCLEKNYRLSGGYQIADDQDGPIEDKLNFAFIKVYQLVTQLWVEHRRSQARHKLWEAEKKAEAEARAKREEEERLRREEKKRRSALLKEARNWQRAELLRKYVTHVEESALATPSSHGLRDWITWARQVADDLDPSSISAGEIDVNNQK